MAILDIFRDAQDGRAIGNLAQMFNLDAAQAEAVLAQLGPEFSYNLEKNTLSRGGIADLLEMLGSGQYDRYATDPDALNQPATRDLGNQVLGQILGSKTRSRALAARASSATGISSTLIKAMLPYIASILMGGLSKTMQGGLGDILQRLPQLGGGNSGGGKSKRARSTGRRSTGRRSGSSPSDSPLPLPGTGSSSGYDDDYADSPLPLPGSNNPEGTDNPYTDISDELRRGGNGGSVLWNMARKILGGALGFQSKGVIGWFIRMLVVRYGWRIVKAIFAGVIGRR